MSIASPLPEDTRGLDPEDPVRKEYLEGLVADYAALHGDGAAWAAFREEAAEWDVTNSDGLEHI